MKVQREKMEKSGYMSPEHAMDGLFSVKSDVLDFGVMMLDIISGKKNTGFYQVKTLFKPNRICKSLQ